jgi:hypothetical protein
MVLGGMVRVTIQGVRLGFFPVNLTFTLGTAAAGAFAGLEVLLFFEAGFLVVTVMAFGGHFCCVCRSLCRVVKFLGKALLSAKKHMDLCQPRLLLRITHTTEDNSHSSCLRKFHSQKCPIIFTWQNSSS